MKNLLLLLLLVILISQCKSDRSVGIDLEYTPGKVELFAENIVSTNLYERDIAISPEGNEIIFTLSDYKQSKRCLVRIGKIDTGWGKKEILHFSGQYTDIEPCFSVDGSKLYFSSDRPVEAGSERKDYNIWVSKRTSSGWGNPEPLQSNINTENNEFFPSLSKNGNLYFTSVRENGIGSEDIFFSMFVEGEFSDPMVLDTCINTQAYEFNAYINPDETLIIFSSFGRIDDIGGGDLYYSRKDSSGSWTTAVNMGPSVNSVKLDYCPFIDIPRGNFYFTSDRILQINKRIENVSEIETLAIGILNGMGNIYRISVDEIGLR